MFLQKLNFYFSISCKLDIIKLLMVHIAGYSFVIQNFCLIFTYEGGYLWIKNMM